MTEEQYHAGFEAEGDPCLGEPSDEALESFAVSFGQSLGTAVRPIC